MLLVNNCVFMILRKMYLLIYIISIMMTFKNVVMRLRCSNSTQDNLLTWSFVVRVVLSFYSSLFKTTSQDDRMWRNKSCSNWFDYIIIENIVLRCTLNTSFQSNDIIFNGTLLNINTIMKL